MNFKSKLFLNLRDKDGITALHYSAFRGDIPIFEFLLQNGADMNLTTIEGYTVMHKAA